jgi:DNA-binding GntR family transcriptional regulator
MASFEDEEELVMPLVTGVVERRPRLREQVYETILGEIRAGHLGQGEALVELDVAARLGVSRTPVREALFQLAGDGLIAEREGERGYRLVALTPSDLLEILEIRMLLEPGIARHAARVARRADTAALARELARERRSAAAIDHGRFVEANLGFRDKLIAMCPNRRLRDCVRQCNDQIQAARMLTLQAPAHRATVVKFHARLVAAIERGQEARAEDAMRGLLEAMREGYLALYGDGAAPAPPARARRAKQAARAKPSR